VFPCLVVHLLGRLDNRLPRGIRTFGDLARGIAQSPAFRSGAPRADA
jgi:hypothetical protein